MIIHLKKSKLFMIEPDKRFSEEYKLPSGTWTEIWKRYKLLGYTVSELCEYHFIKTGKLIRGETMNRWIFRTEIYCLAMPAISKGAEVVISSYFGEYEWDLIKQLTKNLKSSADSEVRSIV